VTRIALILSLTFACSDKSDDTGSSTDTSSDGGSDGGSGLDGASLYASSCSGCHGSDGTNGTGGPSLADEVPGRSDAELIEIMQSGVGSMPPIGVSDDEAQAIVDHLRGLFD
jgi:mono/diheme cytochrome c family protein